MQTIPDHSADRALIVNIVLASMGLTSDLIHNNTEPSGRTLAWD